MTEFWFWQPARTSCRADVTSLAESTLSEAFRSFGAGRLSHSLAEVGTCNTH